MESNKFHSSVELSNLASFSGRLKEVRAKLEKDLTDLGIDIKVAVSDLPKDRDQDKEAIVRLTSLARGNGLFISISGCTQDNFIKVIVPKGSGGQLQGGHH